jgi:hypothetical protein
MRRKPKTEELKQRLAATKENQKQHCPSASPTDKDAIPSVLVVEHPDEDDNIFYVDEPLHISVGVKYRQGNMYAKEAEPMPGEKVIIRYGDGGVQEAVSDEKGEVELWNPRSAGGVKIELPGMSMYSKSIQFNVVNRE